MIAFMLLPLACDDDNENVVTVGPTLPPCDGAGSTSSLVDGHSHFVCVAAPDLASPPIDGGVYTSTVERNHSHTITLGPDRLAAIGRGELITVTSSLEQNHTHSFSLVPTPGPNNASVY